MLHYLGSKDIFLRFPSALSHAGHPLQLPDAGHAHHHQRQGHQEERLCVLCESPFSALPLSADSPRTLGKVKVDKSEISGLTLWVQSFSKKNPFLHQAVGDRVCSRGRRPMCMQQRATGWLHPFSCLLSFCHLLDA